MRVSGVVPLHTISLARATKVQTGQQGFPLVRAWCDNVSPHFPFFCVDRQGHKGDGGCVGFKLIRFDFGFSSKEFHVFEPELLGAPTTAAMVRELSDAEEKIEGNEGEFAHGF